MAIRVSADAGGALNDLRNLEEQVRDGADLGAKKAASSSEDEAERALRNKGSVATGQGVQSLHSKKNGDHEYVLKGNFYLKLVHFGTKPHTPEINKRLKVWADQHGWELDEIVSHIEDQGTNANEWMFKAFDNMDKITKRKVTAEIRRNVTI